MGYGWMTEYAQDGKAGTDQRTDQKPPGIPVFSRFQGAIPMFPALQLPEQGLLVLHSFYKKIGAADDLLVGTADPADQA